MSINCPVQQFCKRLKVSHFTAMAAAKQPSKPVAMALIPEFSHLIVLSNIPTEAQLPIVDKQLSKCCIVDQHNITNSGCCLVDQNC